jgi:hypothetical protein
MLRATVTGENGTVDEIAIPYGCSGSCAAPDREVFYYTLGGLFLAFAAGILWSYLKKRHA